MAQRICSIPDCERPYKSSGYCNRHWLRWKRYGDPLAGGAFQPPKSTRTCSLADCDAPHYSKGYCSRHYLRWLKHGDPAVNLAPKDAPVEERFWASVNQDGPVPEHRPDLGPCWLWKASIKTGGYGQFYADGRSLTAHRYAYELLVGPISDGLDLDHLCRVRRCVRPTHLDPVTNEENKRRGLRGVLTTHCKRGHPFDETNTYWYTGPNGNRWRSCRACREIWHSGGLGNPPHAKEGVRNPAEDV